MILDKEPYVTETGWIELATGILYRKINNIVYLYLENVVFTSVGWLFSIATLPSEARPSRGIRLTAPRSDGMTCMVDISTTGEINAHSTLANSNIYYAMISYCI